MGESGERGAMSLRQPKWVQNLLSQQQQQQQAVSLANAAAAEVEGEEEREPSSSSSSSSSSPVMELVMVLSDQRVYREVVWLLKRGLHDARSEFSFVRVRGLNALVKLVESAASSEKAMELFRDSQSYQELQVVPVLFDYTLAPRKRVAKNLDTTASPETGPDMESSPTTVEVALALRVLEGCCLVSSGCRSTAFEHGAVSELIDFFLAGRPSVQSICLDGLLAVMLDSSPNQKEFELVHGLRKITEMFKSNHLDPDIRFKIAEFIVILVSQVFPNASSSFGLGEGPKPAWVIKRAQQELVEILGEESSALVDSIIDISRQTFSDQENQQSVMLGYAQDLLHVAS